MSEPKPVNKGRIVYYENLETAALVLTAHRDGTVDLQVYRDGESADYESVPYSEEPKAGHWSWHPDEPKS